MYRPRLVDLHDPARDLERTLTKMADEPPETSPAGQSGIFRREGHPAWDNEPVELLTYPESSGCRIPDLTVQDGIDDILDAPDFHSEDLPEFVLHDQTVG